MSSIDRIRELAGINNTQSLTEAVKTSQRKLTAAHEQAVKQIENGKPVADNFTATLIEALAELSSLTKANAHELVTRGNKLSPALLENYENDGLDDLRELNDTVAVAAETLSSLNEHLASFDTEVATSAQAVQATLADLSVKLMARTAALQAKQTNEQLEVTNLVQLTEDFYAPMNKIAFLKNHVGTIDMGPHKDNIMHVLAAVCTSAQLRKFVEMINPKAVMPPPRQKK